MQKPVMTVNIPAFGRTDRWRWDVGSESSIVSPPPLDPTRQQRTFLFFRRCFRAAGWTR